MAKKYIWELEEDIEFACYDYDSGEMVFCSSFVRDSLEEASIYDITDEYFLNKECEFLIYETTSYTELNVLKKKKPNWTFKGKVRALWQELYLRWRKSKNDR